MEILKQKLYFIKRKSLKNKTRLNGKNDVQKNGIESNILT